MSAAFPHLQKLVVVTTCPSFLISSSLIFFFSFISYFLPSSVFLETTIGIP